MLSVSIRLGDIIQREGQKREKDARLSPKHQNLEIRPERDDLAKRRGEGAITGVDAESGVRCHSSRHSSREKDHVDQAGHTVDAQ